MVRSNSRPSSRAMGWTAMFGDEAIKRGQNMLFPVSWRNTDNEPNVESSFDKEYFIDLRELTSGLAGDGIRAGDRALYIRRLDETITKPTDGASVWDVTFAAAWRWYRWYPETDELTKVEGLGYSAGGGGGLYIDGKTYLTQSTADYSETTLVDMSDPAGPKAGITAAGYTYSIFRAR